MKALEYTTDMLDNKNTIDVDIQSSTYILPMDNENMVYRQGGGISSLNESININGQPHRLVWVNPKEEKELKRQGGSGKKVLGKPAYFDEWSMGGPEARAEMDAVFADPEYEYDPPEIGPYDPVPVSDAKRADRYIDGERYDYPKAVPAYYRWNRPINQEDMQAKAVLPSAITYEPRGFVDIIEGQPRTDYMIEHATRFPGGRRHRITQKLYDAQQDWDRIKETPGVWAAIMANRGKPFEAAQNYIMDLAQQYIQDEKKSNLGNLDPDVSDEELDKATKQAVVNAAKNFKGMENVEEAKGLDIPIPSLKGLAGFFDVAGKFFGTEIVATGELNGMGVYIYKDGKVLPMTSQGELANIERGDEVETNGIKKKLRELPIQTASAKEVEKEPSALERLLASRSEVSPRDVLDKKMQERLTKLYNRNIFA